MTVPEKYKFRYRILASADIIGSTAFKSGQASEKKSWAHVFSGFFDSFPKDLARCFEAIDPSLVAPQTKPSRCMDVWKLVGDEILFHAELARHEEAAYHVIALKRALNEYSETLAKVHRGLALKGTVWGAGFPVLNVEVETQVAADGTKARDFLGPQVDLGFRLAATADRRRIPISADIALFLHCARGVSAKVMKEVHICADPPQVLRGILNGAHYPALWVDRLDGLQTAEDRLLGRHRGSPDALLEYLEDLFKPGSIGLIRPFIETDESPHFRSVPEEFIKWRKRLMDDDPDLQYGQHEGRADPTAAADSPPLPNQPA